MINLRYCRYSFGAKLAFALLGLLAGCARKQQSQSDADGWSRARPESVGFDTTKLNELTAAIRRQDYVNMHAVLIEKDGKLVYEEYFAGEDQRRGGPAPWHIEFNAETRHDIRSVSKSVTAALVGIAVGAGLIQSIDQPLLDFFPEYADLATPAKRKITLRHALTMTAGLATNEGTVPYSDTTNDERRMNNSPDPVRFVLSHDVVAAPGDTFRYNGGLTQLLAVAVQRAARKPLLEYAREVLFTPLGITDVEWFHDWPEFPSAASGLRMRAPDLAKFGSLYLNEGRWGDQQVIPASWIAESNRRHMAFADSSAEASHGYGFQWWHSRFSKPVEIEFNNAAGNGGQHIFVVPRLQMVVTMMAGRYNPPNPEYTGEDILLDRIIPAIRKP